MSNGQESDGEHASATEDCEAPPTNQDSETGVKQAVANGGGAQATPVIADDPFAALQATPAQELDQHLFGGGLQDAIPTNDALDITVNELAVDPPPPRTEDHELLGFGEFTPVMAESAPTISDTDVDFGDFGEAPSTLEAFMDEDPPTEADDSFGDFDEAPSPAVAPPEPSPVVDDPANVGTQDEVAPPSDTFPDDDDFGDFNDAFETAEEPPALETDQNRHAFEPPSPAEVTIPEPSPIAHDAKNVGTQDEVASPSDDFPDDDDFGDFNDAVETADEPHPLETDQNIDGFEAPRLAAVAVPEPSPAAHDADNVVTPDEGASPSDTFPDDDDFGDFGDFNEAVETAEVTPQLNSDQNSDGFKVPSPAGAVPEPSPVPDHAANIGTQENVASSLVTSPDDDFDDFGDFNEAVETAEVTPPLPTDQNSDGFGDFGESSESTPPASQSVLEIKDPFVDRARVVFEQIFGPRSIVDEVDVGASDRDIQESVRLVDILSQMREGSSESITAAPDWAIEKLSSNSGILKVIEPSAPSVVLDPRASHPYSHFSRPAQAPILNRSGERKEKRWSSFDLSEKYSFQNPIGNGSVSGSTDETEIAEGLGGPTAAATVSSLPTGVKLDFTSFEAPSEKDDSGNGAGIKNVSTTAQLFLQQVPDLSFMLSSKLDLLKK
ncbi:hypothetical protein MHU86_25750 [Fragilaria crotonensis]|nr:hypothetical protein MHU86_25750 [Fragilaria crotonensis]